MKTEIKKIGMQDRKLEHKQLMELKGKGKREVKLNDIEKAEQSAAIKNSEGKKKKQYTTFT